MRQVQQYQLCDHIFSFKINNMIRQLTELNWLNRLDDDQNHDNNELKHEYKLYHQIQLDETSSIILIAWSYLF